MRGEFNVVRMLQGNRADEDLLRGKCGILSDQPDPGLRMIFGKFGFPELGIRGSAVGAVIARLIEFGILLWFIIRKEKTLQMRLKDFLRKRLETHKGLLESGNSHCCP